MTTGWLWVARVNHGLSKKPSDCSILASVAVYKTMFQTKFDFTAIFLKRFQKSFRLRLLFRYHLEHFQVNRNTFKSQFRPVHWTMALAGALLLLRWALQLSSFPSKMSALINHLSESPPPSHASAKTHHHRAHRQTLKQDGVLWRTRDWEITVCVSPEWEDIGGMSPEFHQIKSVPQRYQMIGRSKLN